MTQLNPNPPPNPKLRPFQLRNALAEWLGWRDLHFYEDDHGPGFWSGTTPAIKPEERRPNTKLPDLTLELLHECELRLDNDQYIDFQRYVETEMVALTPSFSAVRRSLSAPVLVRAVAVLKAIGRMPNQWTVTDIETL